jgi:hypothetical protein
MQVVVFFQIIVSEKSYILFNVMDVPQLKDKGLPISVIFCMTKSLLFIYNKMHFILFYGVVQCGEMLYR